MSRCPALMTTYPACAFFLRREQWGAIPDPGPGNQPLRFFLSRGILRVSQEKRLFHYPSQGLLNIQPLQAGILSPPSLGMVGAGRAKMTRFFPKLLNHFCLKCFLALYLLHKTVTGHVIAGLVCVYVCVCIYSCLLWVPRVVGVCGCVTGGG